jgi:DNA-binding PadR family transcriptional regulator
MEAHLGNFEEVIMLFAGILGEDAYAFKIAEEIEKKAARSVSIGAVHSTLNRLERKGYLTSKFGDPSSERGGRRKRIYTITALGNRVMTASHEFRQSLWDQFPDMVFEYLRFRVLGAGIR